MQQWVRFFTLLRRHPFITFIVDHDTGIVRTYVTVEDCNASQLRKIRETIDDLIEERDAQEDQEQQEVQVRR